MNRREAGITPKFVRMSELPTPYEGLVGQVFADLKQDAYGFLNRGMFRMLLENHNLRDFTLTFCQEMDKPQTSLALAICYYQIFSKSAMREGKRMLFVSRDTIDSTQAEDTRDFRIAEAEGKDALENFFVKRLSKFYEITDNDMELSLELGKFWRAVGSETVDLEQIWPTVELSILLRRQEEANRLNRQFSK